MYWGGPPIWATTCATSSVGTISIASQGQTVRSYGLLFVPGMWTQTSQPTQRSRSISHHDCRLYMLSYCWIFMMQPTGRTARQASQPVQLSALMTASSLGSFLRGPALAMDAIPQVRE